MGASYLGKNRIIAVVDGYILVLLLLLLSLLHCKKFMMTDEQKKNGAYRTSRMVVMRSV